MDGQQVLGHGKSSFGSGGLVPPLTLAMNDGCPDRQVSTRNGGTVGSRRTGRTNPRATPGESSLERFRTPRCGTCRTGVDAPRRHWERKALGQVLGFFLVG